VKTWEEDERVRAQEMDTNNFNLGHYINYAFNAPKRYPSKPFTSKNEPPRKMTDEELERVMHRNYLKFKEQKK